MARTTAMCLRSSPMYIYALVLFYWYCAYCHDIRFRSCLHSRVFPVSSYYMPRRRDGIVLYYYTSAMFTLLRKRHERLSSRNGAWRYLTAGVDKKWYIMSFQTPRRRQIYSEDDDDDDDTDWVIRMIYILSRLRYRDESHPRHGRFGGGKD